MGGSVFILEENKTLANNNLYLTMGQNPVVINLQPQEKITQILYLFNFCIVLTPSSPQNYM